MDVRRGQMIRGEMGSSRSEGHEEVRRGTARDLLESGLFGAWKEIIGDEDSLSFARKLRKLAQERHRG
jgi:hypothetical protein